MIPNAVTFRPLITLSAHAHCNAHLGIEIYSLLGLELHISLAYRLRDSLTILFHCYVDIAGHVSSSPDSLSERRKETDFIFLNSPPLAMIIYLLRAGVRV